MAASRLSAADEDISSRIKSRGQFLDVAATSRLKTEFYSFKRVSSGGPSSSINEKSFNLREKNRISSKFEF